MSDNTELSNYEKMRRGMWYDAGAGDPVLTAARQNIKDKCMYYSTISFSDTAKLQQCLREIFGSMGTGVEVMAPLMCDYGCNVHLGNNVFLNHNTYFMDTNDITLGDRVFVGPNVGFYCAAHPIDAVQRAKAYEKALPITIGSDVWIGGNAVFMPGVTVGSNVVIGAGSVVTRDIPDNCVAVGNPCRVIRQLPPIEQEQ